MGIMHLEAATVTMVVKPIMLQLNSSYLGISIWTLGFLGFFKGVFFRICSQQRWVDNKVDDAYFSLSVSPCGDTQCSGLCNPAGNL